MKKIIIAAVSLLLAASFASAQVLDKQQMKNTTWAGAGAPLDGDPIFYGFTDTFQCRFDINNFTIEGMLNWSLQAFNNDTGDVDYFVLGTSNLNPLAIKYGIRNGISHRDYYGADVRAGDYDPEIETLIPGYNNQANVSNTIQDSYYVNFIWHPYKDFDIGVGTKLNWQVGPAPRYGSWLWESDAHIRQGGFSTSYDDRAGARAPTSTEQTSTYKFFVDAPGTADVVGFVPYANKYAKRAIGVRYFTESNGMTFQLGAAIPNGFNTDDPSCNFGIEVGPFEWLKVSAALEGAFDDQANFYSGATIGADHFILDLYFAAASIFTDTEDDEAYGTGAAITFTIPNTKISVRPELGVNFFENEDYTFAWYTGGTLSFDLSKVLHFAVWSSFAQGSKDKRWDNKTVMDTAYSETKDWTGGHVFNVRPQLTFDFKSNLIFSAYADFEQRQAFDGTVRDCWSTGLFLTYLFNKN